MDKSQFLVFFLVNNKIVTTGDNLSVQAILNNKKIIDEMEEQLIISQNTENNRFKVEKKIDMTKALPPLFAKLSSKQMTAKRMEKDLISYIKILNEQTSDKKETPAYWNEKIIGMNYSDYDCPSYHTKVINSNILRCMDMI